MSLIWSNHALRRLEERLPERKPEDFHFRQTVTMCDGRLIKHCQIITGDKILGRRLFRKTRKAAEWNGRIIRRDTLTDSLMILKQVDIGEWVVLTIYPLEDKRGKQLHQRRAQDVRRDEGQEGDGGGACRGHDREDGGGDLVWSEGQALLTGSGGDAEGSHDGLLASPEVPAAY